MSRKNTSGKKLPSRRSGITRPCFRGKDTAERCVKTPVMASRKTPAAKPASLGDQLPALRPCRLGKTHAASGKMSANEASPAIVKTSAAKTYPPGAPA